MKKSIFSVCIALLCFTAHAEERASLNAQEYDCREYIKECLSSAETSERSCFTGGDLQRACYSSPLKSYVIKRASAEGALFDQKCLRTLDSELSGLLTKDSFSMHEIKSLESKMDLCKKSISEEILKP